MALSDQQRQTLLDEVAQELNEVGLAAETFEEAAAAALGVNRTDLRCLQTLFRKGAMTAGQLADESGLTPGAITTALDRMEGSGYARRVRDEGDRRRVLVELTDKAREPGEQLYGRIAEESRKRMAGLGDDQLLVIRDYLRHTRDLYLEHADLVRPVVAGPGAEQAPPADGEEPTSAGLSAPLGGVTSGRLDFAGGASKVSVRVDPAMSELYRAAYEGAAPEVRVKGGAVSFTHGRRFRPFSFDWGKQIVEVTLNGTIPWEIAVRGGLWKFGADLRGLQLRGFEVSGGASEVTVTLPAPIGTVPVRISGGANKITLHRPAGAAAQAQVTGGATKLVFDGRQLGGIGGKTSVESPGYQNVADRYEIRLSGGASALTIDAR
jgi:DNA-binding MarR family transcriptional regulator